MSLNKVLLKNSSIILLSTAIYFLSVSFGFYCYSTLTLNVECRDHCYSTSLDLNAILNNNIFLIIQLITGSAVLGISTFGLLAYNGVVFGIILANSIENTSMVNVLALILPHGIFEIPAIIIAGAAGFKIPYEIIRYLLGEKGQPLTKEDIKEYLTLALISIILIVIAAWVEANITLKMAKAMLNQTEGI